MIRSSAIIYLDVLQINACKLNELIIKGKLHLNSIHENPKIESIISTAYAMKPIKIWRIIKDLLIHHLGGSYYGTANELFSFVLSTLQQV